MTSFIEDITLYHLYHANAPKVIVPVFKARLPSADKIAPYLEYIDRTGIYSNFGPLSLALQRRLTSILPAADPTMVMTNSGTSALIAGILAHAGWADPKKKLAICPAYTFVATALAVRQCGYEPYLADVGEDWLLDPAVAENHPRLDDVGLVVPVAAYGRPINVREWQSFQKRTGIPVIIDAAAAFEALVDGYLEIVDDIPLAVSFHATKAFGCGEGGALIAADRELTFRAAQAANFGFMGSRNSEFLGFNGKMSEYHAAVALAELDEWDIKRARFSDAHSMYARNLESVSGIYLSPDIASNYVLFKCDSSALAFGLQSALHSASIETRFWYGGGLHKHTSLRHCLRDDLTTTEHLGSSLLGLPISESISSNSIERICRLILEFTKNFVVS